MPFKIVQTQENNRKVLTVVPNNWEKGGILFWPRKMNEIKLIHNEYSMPGPDWKTMRCKTKRTMHSLEEANAELERMEEISDTENDYDSPAPTPTPRPRNKRGTHVLASVDLNDQIAALNNNNYLDRRNDSSSNQPSTSSNPSPAFNTSVQNLIINNDSAQLTRTHSPTGTTSCLMSIAESQCRPRISSAVTLLENVLSQASSGSSNSTPVTFNPQLQTYTNEPILITVPSQPAFTSSTAPLEQQNSVVISNDMLTTIFEEQKSVKRQLAELQATVDILLAHVVNLSSKTTTSNNASSDVNPVIKPAKNREELDDLEELLKNEQNFTATVSAMIFICGSSGKAKGLDCCYKLIDYFFTRDLLLLCSWTGTSRTNDKIPLKYFFNIRKCFLCLVRKADKDFTEQNCDKFFKTVIKNAKQRTNPKIMSTTKHRAKKDTRAPVLQIGEPSSTSQGNRNGEREQAENEENQENLNTERVQVEIMNNEEREHAANEEENQIGAEYEERE